MTSSARVVSKEASASSVRSSWLWTSWPIWSSFASSPSRRCSKVVRTGTPFPRSSYAQLERREGGEVDGRETGGEGFRSVVAGRRREVECWSHAEGHGRRRRGVAARGDPLRPVAGGHGGRHGHRRRRGPPR